MAYKMYIECEDGLKEIPLANRDGEVISETNLENFDMVTSQYKDVGEFLIAMAKKGRLTSTPIKMPYILGTSKIAVKKGVIFNSNLLKHAAKELYDERRKGRNLKDIHLSKSNETAHLTQELKAYAVLKDTRGRTINSRNMPYAIKKELIDYVKIMDKEQQDYVDKDEILQITNRIEGLLTNYPLLRETLFWKQNIINRLKKTNNNVNTQEQINNNQKIENSDIDYNTPEFLDYEQTEDENADILEQIAKEKKEAFERKYREIENPEIKKWYENGGLEAVLNNMDTNDLYNASVEDKEAIGMNVSKKK